MDSWSYVSEGKNFMFEDTVPSPDSLSRSTSLFMGWDPKFHETYYGNNSQFSNQNMNENHQNIEELGFSEIIGNNSIGNIFSRKDLSMDTENTLSWKEDSSSVVESNSRDSLLIDLKLGGFVDQKDTQKSKSFNGSKLSSSESYSSSKKNRTTSISAQNAFCQVLGCNKDLSGSKDYHKRHKVCEAHSKTAKVIVNGIEQRFCQQCSRFHLLGEFDDGKRSCRKRLAGHNERRRKPQMGSTGRLLQPYNGLTGSRLRGPILTATSFIFPNILPEEYGTSDWSKRIKIEDRTNFNPPLAIPLINSHFNSKSTGPSQYPRFHETGSILNENGGRYSHDGPNYGLFRNEEFGLYDAASSSIQGLSGFSSTGCALSLLSSQSHNSSSPLSSISMGQPGNTTGSHAHYSMSRDPGRLLGASSQHVSISTVSKMNVEGNQMNPILVSSGSKVNFDDIFQGNEVAKDSFSSEDGTTIDLLQLSSQLQRVAHQRQSTHGEPENNAFCCLRIT